MTLRITKQGSSEDMKHLGTVDTLRTIPWLSVAHLLAKTSEKR